MRAPFTLFLATVLVAFGCGGGPTAPTTPPPPPAVTLVSVLVTGPTTLISGATAQLSAMAKYSDGTSKDVTTTSTWTSTNTSVGVVTGSGLVTGVRAGDLQISASFENKMGSFDIKVMPPTLVSIRVEGDTIIVAPEQKQFRAIAKYSDSSENDVTSSATFKTLSYGIADVTLGGVVIPQSLGSAQIQGSYQGMSSTVTVRIVGTPWSKLPALSAGAKVLVKTTIASNGMVWRWADGVTTVWANSGIPHQNVVDALTLISTTSNGKFSFVFVADSAAARMVFTFVGPTTPPVPSGHCGWAGATKVENNTLTKGVGSVLPVSGCTGKVVLAHVALHILGLMGHTEPDQDILSSSGILWQMSSLLSEAINWILVVPSGTIPVDG